ncbi:MAG TPA: alpha/beta hydrolase [Gammaproteobacteria bacterium]|nr:alpha/beta hydrolase [Gammaproteobacteria bacterium]
MNRVMKIVRFGVFFFAASAIFVGVSMTARADEAPPTINIWPGVAPGSEHWTWKERVFRNVEVGGKHLGTIIEDVVTPTLTIYLPERGKATGAGVVVAPGGACIGLAMDIEGADVARELQKRGIAAFVLKYRLKHKLVEGMPKNLNEDEACRWGIADAVQALKVVRRHSRQWNVSPNRVGIVGFSAGGMLASETLAQKDAALRPDFAGLIYGAPFASMPAIPATLPEGYKLVSPALPPVFMAWAQDDTDADYAMVRFYKLLKAEGYAPEAHIYHAGGHGFGLGKRGATNSHWLQEFYWWLQAEGFTKPIAK